MLRSPWRQAALAGLVLLILGTAIRVIWLQQRSAEQGELEPQKPTGPLADLVIVVDPGHGGMDPGGVVGETREKEITLQVGLILKELLEARGAQVVMTRSTDQFLGGTIREELGRRVDLIEAHDGDLYLSLHANKDSCNCWGAQTFYQRQGLPESKILAHAIQERLRELTPTTRHALPADYFVLRTATVPAALVEMGFLTNAAEKARLVQPEYQRILATAVAAGVEDYRRLTSDQEGTLESGYPGD